MIHIPIFWTKYTSRARGSRLKFVSCEDCSVEYVYVLEREEIGVGVSMYMLNNEGATSHASSAAKETLSSVLENDFDPVPCPVCGHYQGYMIPRLLGNTGLGVRLILLVAILLGCLAAANAVYRGVSDLLHPAAGGLGSLVTAWSVALLLGVTGFGLSLVNKVLIRRFDPNAGDPEVRIALGRSRAVTRKEFEKAQEVLTSRFDPNVSEPEARIAIDRDHAITREEFEMGRPAAGPG